MRVRRLLLFLIIKSPLYFSARNFGGGNGNGNGWFVGEGGNLIFRWIFLFWFFISCCGDDCFCCCAAGIVALLSRTVEETDLGEGGKGGKGRRRGGAVIVGVRNRGGIGFGEIGIWEFRELGNFLGGGVFIIIVLEAALPVENMCELEIFFFFRLFFRQEWVMGEEEEEEEYDTRVARWWWLESRSSLLTLDL